MFNSEEQEKYARLAYQRQKKLGVSGYYQGENVFVTKLYSPPTRRASFQKLSRIREAQMYYENNNSMFTGRHRSHETCLPEVAKQIQIKLDKKGEAMPTKKTRKPREQRDKHVF